MEAIASANQPGEGEKMSTIKYSVCRNNLGETTAAQYAAYKSAVLAALEMAFPDVEIDVDDSGFANESTCRIGRGLEITRDDVEEAVDSVGESWWDAE